MKRVVIVAMMKLCGEAISLAILVGILIGVIGKRSAYTPLEYSNAFFIAGCLVVIAGTLSRLGAGEQSSYFQRIHAGSFRDMSPGELTAYIVETSSPVRLVILGLLSGSLLILISVLFAKLY